MEAVRDRKKVLFVVWSLSTGGAEKFLASLVQHIPKNRYEAKVVCLKEKGLWAEEVEAAGIEVHCVDKRRRVDIPFLARLVRLLREERPDVVNTYLWTADFWGRIAALLAGVRHIIVTEQNVDLWKSRFRKLIDRALFAWTDYAICVSEEVKRFYRDELRLPENRLRVIPNAVDPAVFEKPLTETNLRGELALDAADFLFVCVARLHRQKAHEVLIGAVAMLRDQGVENFRVLIVGEGDREEPLKSLVSSEKLGGHILFLGRREDVPSILRQSDAFVLSSDYEGTPVAVLEAMAAALPVVVTRVGGNSEVVAEGRSGFVVRPGDPAAFAGAMKNLLQDRERAVRMGSEGRDVVNKRYRIEMAAAETADLFDESLKRG